MAGLRSQAHMLSICTTEISGLPSVLTPTVTAPVCPEEFRLIISYQPPSRITPEQTLLIPFQIGLKRLISSIRTDKLCGEERRETHMYLQSVQSVQCSSQCTVWTLAWVFSCSILIILVNSLKTIFQKVDNVRLCELQSMSCPFKLWNLPVRTQTEGPARSWTASH